MRGSVRGTKVSFIRSGVPLLLCAAVLAGLLLASGCAAGSDHGAATASASPPASSGSSEVVARVNGEPVSRAEVEHAISFSRLSAKALTYRQALEATIRRHLLGAEAGRLGVTVAESDVDARLAQVTASLGGSAALQQSLAAVGLTLVDYRDELRAGLLAEQLGSRMFPAAAVSGRQVAAFYRSQRAQLTTPAAVRLAEIVVKTQSLGRAVVDRLHKGYSFAEVARAYSMDRESAEAGGVVGWVTTSSLPPQLTRVLPRARLGLVVGPIQAMGGWHVLKVLGRRQGHTQSLAVARAAIVAQLKLERRAVLLSGWLTKARAAAHVTHGS
jgi:parvulin-like peptidyl-prolyl isomerase